MRKIYGISCAPRNPFLLPPSLDEAPLSRVSSARDTLKHIRIPLEGRKEKPRGEVYMDGSDRQLKIPRFGGEGRANEGGRCLGNLEGWRGGS